MSSAGTRVCRPLVFNSLLASVDLSSAVYQFANSLDPDQDRQNVGPDLNANRLTH